MIDRKLSVLFAVCLLLALPLAAEPPATDAAPAPAGQASAVAAACARCGDGYCARSCENERTCPADCAPQTVAAVRCGKCGDGTCVPQCGETALSCPVDCGGSETSSATETKPAKCEPAKTAEPKKE